jgi:hypothetical protein
LSINSRHTYHRLGSGPCRVALPARVDAGMRHLVPMTRAGRPIQPGQGEWRSERGYWQWCSQRLCCRCCAARRGHPRKCMLSAGTASGLVSSRAMQHKEWPSLGPRCPGVDNMHQRCNGSLSYPLAWSSFMWVWRPSSACSPGPSTCSADCVKLCTLGLLMCPPAGPMSSPQHAKTPLSGRSTTA